MGQITDVFDLDKNLIFGTTMDKMKWEAKRPRDASLNNEKAIKLLNNKPISVNDEIKMVREDLYVIKQW